MAEVTISNWEARLISVARAIVGGPGSAADRPLAVGRAEHPPAVADDAHRSAIRELLERRKPSWRAQSSDPVGVTGPALELLQKTLALGTVLTLMRRGGWRSVRHVVDGSVRSGRLWERHRLPPLRFGPFTFEALRWLAYQTPMLALPDTIGDHVIAYLLADRLQHKLSHLWTDQMAASPLPWLAWPNLGAGTRTKPPSLDAMTALVQRGRPVLEALQDDLAQHVVDLERRKGQMSVESLITVGEAQQATLDAFMTAVHDAPDLARFVCIAGAMLAEGNPTPEQWFAGDTRASLAQRAVATRGASAFLRTVDRRASWNQRFSAVRFFEDDYDVAQLHLEDWAVLGVAGHTRLKKVADALEAFAPAVEVPPSTPPR